MAGNVETARRAASRRPEERRRAGEPWTVHRILAAVEDEAERFATILTPPEGRRRCAPRGGDVLRGARQGFRFRRCSRRGRPVPHP
ncbi:MULTISPECIES: DUF6192 family protein [Streptomyces]|uniref:DUF6192 family protein n=1 Tax=Streptomyces TaxID=1883 RepID=UPI001CCC76CD|nr:MULTISPECIES: DUF6192 family protein [Streptomyces]UBI41345.1 DUF6192 family protein [Streptomyces mobaraensis]